MMEWLCIGEREAYTKPPYQSHPVYLVVRVAPEIPNVNVFRDGRHLTQCPSMDEGIDYAEKHNRGELQYAPQL